MKNTNKEESYKIVHAQRAAIRQYDKMLSEMICKLRESANSHEAVMAYNMVIIKMGKVSSLQVLKELKKCPRKS